MSPRWKHGRWNSPNDCRYPRPVLLAIDPNGDHVDVPALVMTLFDGRPVWESRWGDKLVPQTVEAMIALQDIDDAAAELPALTTYAQ